MLRKLKICLLHVSSPSCDVTRCTHLVTSHDEVSRDVRDPCHVTACLFTPPSPTPSPLLLPPSMAPSFFPLLHSLLLLHPSLPLSLLPLSLLPFAATSSLAYPKEQEAQAGRICKFISFVFAPPFPPPLPLASLTPSTPRSRSSSAKSAAKNKNDATRSTTLQLSSTTQRAKPTCIPKDPPRQRFSKVLSLQPF